MRYKIYAKAERWNMALEVARSLRQMMPEHCFGHFHFAYCLHELKRTQEAYDVLKQVVDQFPEEWLIRYNLACYSCQLGNLKEALEWFEQATELTGKKDIRLMALDDKDLEPLWNQIGEI